MKPFPNLLPKWAVKTLGVGMTQHMADTAANAYMMGKQPGLMKAKKFKRVAEDLLGFLESGQCSPTTNLLLESWTDKMLAMLKSNHQTAAAQQVATRLAAVKAKRLGFEIPTLG